MLLARRTHILFDFFGTLVDYSPSRTEQGYGRSHALLRRLGAELSYVDFLAQWSRVCAGYDERSDRDDSEFSMMDAGQTFLADALGRRPAADDLVAFVNTYVQEWNAGVRDLNGLPELVDKLAGEYRLAVVTNTHQPDLVPGHLVRMGLRDRFDAVITSVEVGWRKPHPAIYATALSALGVDAESAIFVGDTYLADYLGPERAGMAAYLIDPRRLAPAPDERRLDSVFDLPHRLAGRRGGQITGEER